MSGYYLTSGDRAYIAGVIKQEVEKAVGRAVPALRTHRSSVVRRVDALGRVVIDKGARTMMGLVEGSGLLQTVVTDADGRLRGILLEPLDYVASPDQRPEYTEALQRLMRTTPGPDLPRRNMD